MFWGYIGDPNVCRTVPKYHTDLPFLRANHSHYEVRVTQLPSDTPVKRLSLWVPRANDGLSANKGMV